MNTSGEAADQIVRMTLNGVEVAAKISGAGAKQLAVMLYAIMKDQKKTKGKIRMESMLRSGKELKIFAIKNEDLQKFTAEAKKYGVLYCVLRDKNSTDGINDIMVRAEDSSKINRIFDRFKFAVVDMASIKSDIEKSKTSKDSEKQPNERDVPVKSKEDILIDELMPINVPDKTVQKEQAQNQNPTTAQTTKSLQSEPTSKPKEKSAKGTFEPNRSRISVREELNDIKAEKAKSDKVKKDEPKQQKTNRHKAPPKKKSKNKKDKEK